MKVLVLTTRVPFIRGGAEQLRDHLVTNLQDAGVEAESMSLPFSWNPAERLLQEMTIARAIEVTHADRVIALKFPAYLVPHHNKVIWLVHQYRQAYDLWDQGQSNIPASPRGEEIRAMIRSADERAFDGAKALYCISPITLDRLQHYHGLSAPVLPSPINDPERFTGGEFGGYVFAGGRVGQAKRQALIVEALAHAPGVRLVVAGPADAEGDAQDLERIAARHGLADRLVLDIRLLSRAEYARLINGSSAVVYIPFKEDSPGYVTLEAFQAGKPVVTTTDSGGVLEIVRPGETGFVAEPTPESLGAALSAAVAPAARPLGSGGRALMDRRSYNWKATVERLLS